MSDTLMHYGVLGMKWGIRKDRLSLKTKSGDIITLSEHPSTKLALFLAKHSKRIAEEQDKTALFDIKGSDGKTVGDIQLYKETVDSINVVWVTTNDSVRGRGYGTAVMKSAIQIAKDTGAKQVTLEVPGNSPDARHIYEKLGFKDTGETLGNADDYWGGLTKMRLDLNEINHSSSLHSGLIKIPTEVLKNFMSYLADEIDALHSEDYLKHYGILGMKWGVRRTPAQLSRIGGASKNNSVNSKKNVKDMSDDELRKAVNRLQLEKQYSQLSENKINKGRQYTQKIIKAGTTVAAVTTTGLTIYNNAGKINDIIKKVKG